ncbi:MAG TPA: methionine adenosyltransferase [Candidatus Woesebacteria bacterium]|jgi:S-adenosylmethionine synthetase|nr:methionine adenosyltransferase [Candidatus Shapirobacteria bacterium]HOR01654.1 methionine adenosyltransferase [Candidatus Woesebacteria bacterium]
MNYPVFVSESVCAGHPDKICDQVSDGILDEALSKDKNARVAVETLVTVNKLVMAGEVSCRGEIDYKSIAKKIVADLGYTDESFGFWHESPIEVWVHQQSEDIAVGVDNEGAGDQGMMYGYACRETPELMPLPIMLSHTICRKMDELMKKIPHLRPDGKAEVSVVYENGKPVAVEKIVLAKPHSEDISGTEVKKELLELVIWPALDKFKLNKIAEDKIIFNGTGAWRLGGPASDTGVTGRKIVVDTYGGMGRIGGGCFSGKDPTKVDRSGAYAARYVAKNIVAAGLAERCEVQLAYAIGKKEPVAKSIETFGTAKKSNREIESFSWGLMDLSVGGIINKFDLKRPIYQKTARYGHFGNIDYPWEKLTETR